MFPLHCILQIYYAESLDKGLIIRVKSFSLRLTRYSQGTSMTHSNGQRNDNRATDALYSIGLQLL